MGLESIGVLFVLTIFVQAVYKSRYLQIAKKWCHFMTLFLRELLKGNTGKCSWMQ